MTDYSSLYWFDECLRSSSTSQHHRAHDFFFKASQETKNELKSHTQNTSQHYLTQPLSSTALQYITSSFELYHLDTLSAQQSFILPTLHTLTFDEPATTKPSLKQFLRYKRYATPDNYYQFSQQLPFSEYCFRLLEYTFIHLLHLDTYLPQYSSYHRSVDRALRSYNTYIQYFHTLPLATYTSALQNISTLPEHIAPVFYKQLLVSKHPGVLYSKNITVPSSVLQYSPNSSETNFLYTTFTNLLSTTPELEAPLLNHSIATFHQTFLKNLSHYFKQNLPTSSFAQSIRHYLAMPQNLINNLQEYVLETQNIERL